jgi:hypothetical protein
MSLRTLDILCVSDKRWICSVVGDDRDESAIYVLMLSEDVDGLEW